MATVPPPPEPPVVVDSGSGSWGFIAGGLFVLLVLALILYFVFGSRGGSTPAVPTTLPRPGGSPGGFGWLPLG